MHHIPVFPRLTGISSALFLLLVSQFTYAAEESQASPQEINTESQPAQANVTIQQNDGLTFQRVISATRTETPISEVASSMSVITQTDMERKQINNVLDALRGEPGLDIVQQGVGGGASSVFIRGANADDTLFLIDGVEINDPISPGRSFNFTHLIPTENIRRIEVLRGPQSTLYGSDAIGGVVNIITERGEGDPSFFATTEAGSYGTFIERTRFSGGSRWFNYSMGGSRMDSDGISTASENDGNFEDDAWENTALSARIGFTPTNNLKSDVIMHYINTHADLDNFGGVGGEDPNYFYNNRLFILRTQATLSLFDNRWQQTMGMSLTDHNRESRNNIDLAHPLDLARENYDGQVMKWDWQHDVYLNRFNTLVFGAEHEKETGSSTGFFQSLFGAFDSNFNERSNHLTGVYIEDQIKLGKRLFSNVGMRINNHSQFGSKNTYHLGVVYFVPETGTRLKATYGTGFKAPTLYQLYSTFGTPTLEAETSTGWDAGIEQRFWEDKLVLGATYFSNDYDNLIDFDNITFKYLNIAKAKAKGVELFSTFQPCAKLFFRTNYTYTDTLDELVGDSMLRRPRNKLGAEINYQILPKLNLNLSVIRVGDREDMDFALFPASRVILRNYTLANLAVSYDLTRYIQVFGRIQNIFNDGYEEVKGYGTLGTNAYVGLKMLI